MANAQNANDLTRQQLDDLDALLQKMLSSPANQPDSALTLPSMLPLVKVPPVPAVQPVVEQWRTDRPTPTAPKTPYFLGASELPAVTRSEAASLLLGEEPVEGHSHDEPTPKFPGSLPTVVPEFTMSVRNAYPDGLPSSSNEFDSQPAPQAVTSYSPALPQLVNTVSTKPLTPASRFALGMDSDQESTIQPSSAQAIQITPLPKPMPIKSIVNLPEFDRIELEPSIAHEPIPTLAKFIDVPTPSLAPQFVPKNPQSEMEFEPTRGIGQPLIKLNQQMELVCESFGPPGKLVTHSYFKQFLGLVGIVMILGACWWTLTGLGFVHLRVR